MKAAAGETVRYGQRDDASERQETRTPWAEFIAAEASEPWRQRSGCSSGRSFGRIPEEYRLNGNRPRLATKSMATASITNPGEAKRGCWRSQRKFGPACRQTTLLLSKYGSLRRVVPAAGRRFSAIVESRVSDVTQRSGAVRPAATPPHRWHHCVRQRRRPGRLDTWQ